MFILSNVMSSLPSIVVHPKLVIRNGSDIAWARCGRLNIEIAKPDRLG